MTEAVRIEAGMDGVAHTRASRAVLRADGLVKSFRSRKVVKGVSVDVAAGEVVGLLGPNGAGKTTIFDMMVGLTQPDEGTITLNGEPITALAHVSNALETGSAIFRRSPPCFAGCPCKTISWQFWKCWITLVRSGRNGWMPCSTNSILGTSGPAWPTRFPAENGDDWKLPGPWRPIPRSCCSMNRLPGSIPLPSPTFSRSSSDSKAKASAFLSPITMCKKRCRLPTAPISSMKAWSSKPALPTAIVKSETARAVYLGERFSL